jgi:NAD(P)-dependent dehydrogenase (short-subunit alcohol dehydrogenase family)
MNSFSLEGRVALVTGGSRGIGRAIALALASAGAAVAVLGRDAAALEETRSALAATGARHLALAGDVTRREDIDAAVEACEAKLGPIHTLVCSAGIHQLKPFTDLAHGEWERLMAVNIGGVLSACHAAGPRMIARGAGSVILLSSIYALVGAPGNTVYCMTKGAVLSFARALAIDWAPHGVRVNAICPGWINTDLNAGYREDPKAAAASLRQIPIGRFGAPEDIGPLAVFLASDAASFATGQHYVLDGGQTAR